MEKKIQKLSISIPQNIEVGKLIGREGRNLKPIAERTGTNIYIDTKVNPPQIKIHINKKKENPPFENRINDARNQLNNLMKNVSKSKFRNEEQVEDKFSLVEEKEENEKMKISPTSLITTNTVNEDLPEKFSQTTFKEKRNNKKLPISDDRMCWYGVDCKKNFCRFKHPQNIIDHRLILKYKKEIETKKRKRDFKKESRIFLHKYRNSELLKKFLKLRKM